MKYETILVADNGPVRTITLDRPERRNAMTPEMQMELIAAMGDAWQAAAGYWCSRVRARRSVRVWIYRRCRRCTAKRQPEHRADAERIARLFRTLYELPIPTIAAVHGTAIAGGTGLAMICDFIVATPDAKFGFTEARIGFVPALVSAFLVLQIGDKRSRDLLLTGRLFDAEEAWRLGLVNQVVPPEELEQRVKALAEILIANSPMSLEATKRLMAAQNRAWLDAALNAALEANAQARETADFREGVAAFLEKRRPIWAK